MGKTIIELFIENAASCPDKAAVKFNDLSLSYKEVSEQVSNLSCGLWELGVRTGDKVGVLLPNNTEFVILMLAAANLGAVLVPQNMTIPAKTSLRLFKKADVKCIVAWHAVMVDFKEAIQEDSGISLWVSVGGDHSGCKSFDYLAHEHREYSLRRYPVSGEQDYIITMTSGSTAEPKPIVLSQNCKILRAQAAMRIYNITKDDITLVATPLYHSLAKRLVLIPLLSGGTSVIMSGFTPDEWLKVVSKEKISFSIAVSSQLKQILNKIIKNEYDLSSLRCLVSSSELLDISIKTKLVDLLKCEFHECYGASEVAIVTNLSPQDGILKPLSVGNALPEVDIKILNEKQELAPSGEVGEIICKTPMCFLGYYKQPEKTAEAIWKGYFRTGDIGKLDDDGFLYFLGRSKDIIITGGINVYPKDVENVINTHPDVIECTVIPLPDAKLGEMVTAVIVSNGKDFQLRRLQRLCATELADFQQPRKYIIVDSLPKNSMGKILKNKLIQKYSQRGISNNE